MERGRKERTVAKLQRKKSCLIPNEGMEWPELQKQLHSTWLGSALSIANGCPRINKNNNYKYKKKEVSVAAWW
jgi:hypothetical protein